MQEASDSHGIGQPSGEGGSIHSCMYCHMVFPHQRKLTQHMILLHSFDPKFRDTFGVLPPSNILPSEMFMRHGPPPLEPFEPPDGNNMDIDYPPGASGSNSSLGSGDQGVVLCKFCGKSFPDVTSLITHLPVHTGDRPFKCEYCGKAFKLRHHMKDHCRVHTGKCNILLIDLFIIEMKMFL